jgi:hypothetical protein
MADAASAVVGIISFGLEVCGALYEYCYAYKSFDSSIDSAFESIAQVLSTLYLLEEPCKDDGLDLEQRDKVAACVRKCKGELDSLNDKLQHLRMKDPQGFREKVKAQFKRSTFPFKEKSLGELRNNADEAERQLSSAIQVLELDQMLKSRKVLNYLETWSNGVTIALDHVSNDTGRLLSLAESREIDDMKNWLSAPDPWENQQAARELHQAKTGQWLLENNAYKAWLCGASRHLWLYGKAGCGKTILSSTIVEHVQNHCLQAVGFGFAPFYFTFSNPGKQTLEALLRSMVAQLGSQEPGLKIMRERFEQRHKLQGGLSVQILQSMFLAVLAAYDTVFVVLDALDECPEDYDASLERSKLFDGLEYLSKAAANLRILMTSRDVPDIRDCIARLPAERLPIVTSAVNVDIHKYVTQQLSKSPFSTKLDAQLKNYIQDRITSKADGM